MRRLHRATSKRALRALIGIGAVLMLALVAGGCAGGPSNTAPTPDPFAGLTERSDQAFRQGLEAYGEGQYRDALTSFQQARTLSPSADPRIDQMLERTTAAMAPTKTPVPATPTEVPAAPTAVPLVMSTQKADTQLGERYFGHVSLAVVPGRDSEDSPAATQFFFQDQMGLRIDGLKQHLRLPFTLRVFNTDTAGLVGEVQSDDILTAVPTSPPPVARNVSLAATPTAAPTLSTPAFQVARFWDSYVWYHKGGEEPGRYRAELYANGVLTHSFDYTVVSVPVASPEPTLAPTVEPTASLPTVEEAPAPPPPAPVPASAPPVSVRAPSVAQAPVSAPVAPVPTPQPTAIPLPTAAPTASTAAATQVGGLPSGLDVNPNDGRVFIADGSGVVWTSDPSHPASFNRPISLDHLPQDLAVDASTGNVFVSARNESAVLVLDASGQRLSTIQMPAAPGDLRIDSQLGLVYVVLPDRQALAVIDARGGHLMRTIDGLPQITSLALDPVRHTLYAGHLGGQLSIVDVASSQVTARMTLTGVGLSSVATARGMAYAVNTVTHELAVVEPVSQTVNRYVLAAEPAAITASENSGSVYVLASKPDAIVRLDPTDGTELGRVTLPNRSGRFGLATRAGDQAGFQGLRSRMVLNPINQSVYVTLPESGTFSLVPDVLFPPLTHDIPWVEAPAAPLVAYSIPGVIRPAAAALPSQPTPALQARAQTAAIPDPITDQEAN
jgi:hypothetical protein